ncbi:spliceosome assembly protein PRP11 KNAG_0K01810 [Huiozyma naganishii CBS 8797]|uniref:U1-type domain-containing protein n=1 Tax=Huiozyma naganishii (strain ATCC MYA-139 / BCRC 22969 / CBS 8797 / KCTC 17520 / NBRC 10181 / NCYC 3082 / Yp74L-3) TaxID=1071383 RepID=J7SAX5_HUIN7|nr:hypothetical protein KNAG_0K01810 [Kazachstania naganishii CBS 8797]CCK72546.1 hypothetical protein KNAG_0K01810 [Kazachstania naganishii CBS 8797]
MDYSSRAGSKKGGGGMATESEFNLQRRRQVEQLLSHDQEIPYTYATQDGVTPNGSGGGETRSDPYIYKNRSGKLICKLCNTLHMSWSSVERHLQGKKHGLNVLRRVSSDQRGSQGPGTQPGASTAELEYQAKVDETRKSLGANGVTPACQVVPIRDTHRDGLAIRVEYSGAPHSRDPPPFIRIMSSFELPGDDNNNKGKTLIIAYPPFNNVGVPLDATRDVEFDVDVHEGNISVETPTGKIAVDRTNAQLTYWDAPNGLFYVQFLYTAPETQQDPHSDA